MADDFPWQEDVDASLVADEVRAQELVTQMRITAVMGNTGKRTAPGPGKFAILSGAVSDRVLRFVKNFFIVKGVVRLADDALVLEPCPKKDIPCGVAGCTNMALTGDLRTGTPFCTQQHTCPSTPFGVPPHMTAHPGMNCDDCPLVVPEVPQAPPRTPATPLEQPAAVAAAAAAAAPAPAPEDDAPVEREEEVVEEETGCAKCDAVITGASAMDLHMRLAHPDPVVYYCTECRERADGPDRRCMRCEEGLKMKKKRQLLYCSIADCVLMAEQGKTTCSEHQPPSLIPSCNNPGCPRYALASDARRLCGICASRSGGKMACGCDPSAEDVRAGKLGDCSKCVGRNWAAKQREKVLSGQKRSPSAPPPDEPAAKRTRPGPNVLIDIL